MRKQINKPLISVAMFITSLILCAGLIVAIRETGSRRIKKVRLERTSDSHYQLLIDNRPFFIKGICYNPVPIGEGSAFDFWSAPKRPWVIDGDMMKDMGINTVRLYSYSKNPEHTRAAIRYLYRQHGIRTILSHYLGFWQNPDYSDPDFKEMIYKEALDMVKNFKDEPGVLLWLLGSENNFSFGYQMMNFWTSPEIERIADRRQRDRRKAEIYYSFVDELAGLIHEIDPNRPVALGNGDVEGLEIAGRICKNIDILGLTAYRGKGFGNLWRQVKKRMDKPVFIAEFGCDAYNSRDAKEDEDTQAEFLKALWEDIMANSAGQRGAGNSLGGCIFEWTDEWWKYEGGNYSLHDTIATWTGYGYYYDIKEGAESHNMNEEWWGIVALETEKLKDVDRRRPRKTYYTFKEMWAE